MSTQPASNESTRGRSFYYVWGAVMLLLSIGCAADGANTLVGRIGECGTSAEHFGAQPGWRGELEFYHSVNALRTTGEAEYFQFDPYLMRGAWNTYYVADTYTERAARITEVSTSEPDVISIAAVYDSSFDVEAIGIGSAEITVRTEAGVTDRVELFVTDVARVEFEHCCTYDSRAMYLADSEFELPVTYFDSYGETPIGFGRLPVDISRPGDLTYLPDAPDPADVHFRTGPNPGVVTLTPRVAGERIDIEIVDPQEVDGVSVHVEPDQYASGLWMVGGVLYRGETPLCAGKYPMRMETLTPSVCQFLDSSDRLVSSVDVDGDQIAWMEERRQGDCEVRIELLDSSGRVVLEQTNTTDFGSYDDRR